MAFNLPVQNFFTRTEGPIIWVRPSDWPVITDAANEVQYLISDQGDSNCSIQTNFTRTSGSQNIRIEWGDGTTSTVSTTGDTTTNKTYTPGTGTPCSLGYTTFKIRVYFTGTGVSVFNTASISVVYLAGNTSTSQTCYALEAYFGDGTTPSTPCNFYGAPGNGTSRAMFIALKYVKYPNTVSWTNIQNLLSGASSLARLVLPRSMSSVTSSNNMFTNCYELEEVIFPSNATQLNSLTSMFLNCNNLQRVTFPTTLNNCTIASSAFQSCLMLRYVTLPPMNNCTSFVNTFNGCFQLEWVKFTSMPTVGGTIDFLQTFATCLNLQNVYFPATGVSTNTYSFSTTFSQCNQLKNIVFPSNININALTSTFSSCTGLISCIFPTSMPGCTTMAGCFVGNWSLRNVTLPTTVSAGGINFSNVFNGCSKLETIRIPSSYLILSMANTFQNCNALKTVIWSPGAQNSLSSLNLAFSNCRNLTSITLPTSMTGLTTLANAFTNCSSLESVVLPSALNSVTTIATMFSGCSDLISVTFPISMSTCNTFSNVFNSCFQLKSVIFPFTVSSLTSTFASAFSNCYALEAVTFPGSAQLSTVSAMNPIFVNCSNLKTITNFDKIGSLTATPLMNASANTGNRFTSISFVAPLNNLGLQGATGIKADVQSVRLLNTSAGQWTGVSPHINVSNTNMSTAQLVQLFNDMAAQGNVSSKTINITSATGAAGLTAGDRLIVTSRGWTITG
jgi:hypothetical protein